MLVALHEDVLGGATLAVLRMLPELERRGCRLAFWLERPTPLATELEARGLEVHGGPRPIAYSRQGLALPPGPARRILGVPGYLGRFARFLRRHRPDVVHANSLLSLVEAGVARAMRVPTVLHVHEIVPSSGKGRVAALTARLGSDVVAAVSESCAASLAPAGIEPRIVYGGTEIPDRPVGPPPEGRFAVGMIGTIIHRKGTDVFLRAAELVRERAPAAEFELIGSTHAPLEPDYVAEVVNRASQAGITHRESGDVEAAMRGWDLVVLPSRADPFPSVVLEAMALGVPVVGSAVDGIREQVTPATGALVPPDDPRALAAAILELRDAGPERRREIGLAGRRRMIERFTLERQAEGMRAAYDAAIGDSPTRP
ncbi:MAG: glycosyltransferase family 4 protein [Solirubrobacterales bacterium]